MALALYIYTFSDVGPGRRGRYLSGKTAENVKLLVNALGNHLYVAPHRLSLDPICSLSL